MTFLGDKLIGKIVFDISSGPYDWGIVFTDGSGFQINTRIEASLLSKFGERKVTNVKSTDDMLEIILGNHSYIRIILDEDLLTGPEFFVYFDTDGTTIVEN